MQDVGHEAVENGCDGIRFVHGCIAMGTGEATLDVEERMDHVCLGEGDCIFDGWLVEAATFDCVGGDDGQEESEEIGNQEKHYHRYY